jgi:hypothetical protein
MRIHGDSKTNLWQRWSAFRQRCMSQHPKTRRVYYDRNITWCDEWDNYLNFKIWAKRNGYSPELTLDRINNYKGYSPDNCRFVTRQMQSQNRRPSSEWIYEWKVRRDENNLTLPFPELGGRTN